MKRKLLVTGGAGFIGSNFIHYWSKKYPEDLLLVLDDLTYAGNLKNIKSLIDQKKVFFEKKNICDKEAIIKIFNEFHITHLINFAAESHVDRSIKNPDEFLNTNILGTYNLLEAFRKHWEKNNYSETFRFLQISTDEVFGSLSKENEKFYEKYPYNPQSPYSASKASADHLVQAWGNTYGIPVLRSNCSNNYGPFHYPEKLIPLAITNIFKGKEIPIYGDGSNIRDWLHVYDHCAALELILLSARIGESFCIGGDNQITNLELIQKICLLMNKFNDHKNTKFKDATKLIKFVEDRKGHDYRYSVSNKKISKTLGWHPSIPLDEGLKLTINWYFTNNKWWDI